MGPEGFEPPPTGLKGRHAAATPRPRAGHLVPGYSFDPDHRISPRYDFCQRVRAAGFEPAVSSSPSLRISQAFPRPDRSCEQPVWESNPPLRLERAVSSADRRTSQLPRVGRGALESPSAGLQPAARPSQLPTRSAVPTKRPGVFVTPGLRLHARDVRGRASRPQGIEPRAGSPTDRRIASLPGNPGCDADSRRTWTTSVQGMSQADSTRDRPHGPPVVLHPYRRVTPGGCSRDFEEMIGLARGNLPPQGLERV